MHYRTDQIKVFTAEKELRNIQSITVGDGNYLEAQKHFP